MTLDQMTLQFSGADEIAYALAASPRCQSEQVCFAACSNGLWRSDDGGRSWEALQLPRENGEALLVTALAVSPGFAQDRSVYAAVKGGILRSSDGGDNWYTTAFPAPPPLFSAIAASPNFLRDGALLAGTLEDGVFSSMDRGVRWQPWNFGLFDLSVLCVALSPRLQEDETAFAGAETGLYRSTNGGRAWRLTSFPEDYAPVLSLAIVAESQSKELTILAGTEDQGLMSSQDGGATWQRSDEFSSGASVNQIVVFRRDDAIADVYALSDERVLHSRNAGNTWTEIARFEQMPTAMQALDAGERNLLVGLRGQGIMRLAL